jgi:L-fuculose-phosphate aldolase
MFVAAQAIWYAYVATIFTEERLTAMDYACMHPRDELVLTMQRIYQYRMTTTSGGNLSIMDENGDIWITPARVDKGDLRPQDIVCVRHDGKIDGLHKPSSEYPFHQAIYRNRPNVRAVVHAHPVSLVAFSINHTVPNMKLFPESWRICGEIGFAPYGVPGSEDLGKKIAEKFHEGFNSVILENHGVVTGGETLQDAFHRFETLEFAAKILIKAKTLGEVNYLSDAELRIQQSYMLPRLNSFEPVQMTVEEKELRRTLANFVMRGYHQRLLTSTIGSFSARLDNKRFLITPFPLDRNNVDPAALVLIDGGRREGQKTPSRAVLAHKAIYDTHPEIGAIINAYPVSASAFGVCQQKVDTKTIPESYVFLRDVKLLDFAAMFSDIDALPKTITPTSPVAILRNNGVIVTGQTVLDAFDKIEVLDFTAEAILDSQPLGGPVLMTQEVIDDLCKAFNLPLGK